MSSHRESIRLESSIEHRVVEYAKSKNYDSLKLTNKVGWPDRVFILPFGKSIFIEFKKPGGVLSPAQKHVINKLKDKGHLVFICYSAEEAIEILEANK